MRIVLKYLSILMIILIFLSTNVLAVSDSDLTNINNDIDKTKKALEGVENQKSSTMLEISKLK